MLTKDYVFVHPIQDGMATVAPLLKSAIMADNGMYLSICVNALSTVGGMGHFV